MSFDKTTGLVGEADFQPSPNCDPRQHHQTVEAIIVHSISLPPGEYGNSYVADLFLNRLDPAKHPYFEQIHHLKVSSHFFIERDGQIIQFVPTTKRAWHAGESVCLGKAMVNDFSIGIELEGWDEGDDGFTQMQYQSLNRLISLLKQEYAGIQGNIFAHSDIAPGRKQDPGPYFDWDKVELG